LSKTVNPAGAVGSFVAMLAPIEKIEFGPRKGVAGSARERAHAEAMQRGYDEGFEQGFSQGESAGRANFEAAHLAAIEAFVSDLDRRVEEVGRSLDRWSADLEGPIASLATVVAARILAREIESDPDYVLRIAKSAIAEVTHAREARVKVNPFDAPAISEHRADLFAAAASVKSIEIVEDPSILGGCLIETDGGSIDARIESMLDEAKDALRGGA